MKNLFKVMYGLSSLRKPNQRSISKNYSILYGVGVSFVHLSKNHLDFSSNSQSGIGDAIQRSFQSRTFSQGRLIQKSFNENPQQPISKETNSPDQKQGSKVELSLLNIKEWTPQQVASLLCMEKSEGGASLDVEKVKPLYNAGFDGNSLYDLCQDIKIQNVDFVLATMSQSNDYSQVSESTRNTVVYWVKDFLMTKRLTLWTKDQVKSALGQPKSERGAGLTTEKVQAFYNIEFNGFDLSGIVRYVVKRTQSGHSVSASDIGNEHGVIGFDTWQEVLIWINDQLIPKSKLQVSLTNIF
ncbi:hypothetical protein FDP41_003026 [Naegleria fowleri]|uniref:Uncharacterized protein n=1 Tax=Naegleria fowleri TaxID=5763 RepID=A0A6A5BTY2_NAEFO|nr:uncharacterized protein FDP41_003026 [Naegleria fowleri]KAF0977704.1 hypothetical protein FDP41_003026 [Naegleria fowleri]